MERLSWSVLKTWTRCITGKDKTSGGPGKDLPESRAHTVNRMRCQKEPLLPITRNGKKVSSDTAPTELPITAVRISFLFLAVKQEGLKGFFPLLQEGFLCEMDLGESLLHFLRERLGLNHHEDITLIGTVFIDENPVDSMEETILEGGTSLFISGMEADPIGSGPAPGRLFPWKGRTGSYRNRRRTDSRMEETGMVHVKLLNTLKDDRCAWILHKGILIDAEALESFFSGRGSTLFEMIEKLTLSGIEEDPGILVNGRMKTFCDWVHLVIQGGNHGRAGGFPENTGEALQPFQNRVFRR